MLAINDRRSRTFACRSPTAMGKDEQAIVNDNRALLWKPAYREKEKEGERGRKVKTLCGKGRRKSEKSFGVKRSTEQRGNAVSTHEVDLSLWSMTLNSRGLALTPGYRPMAGNNKQNRQLRHRGFPRWIPSRPFSRSSPCRFSVRVNRTRLVKFGCAVYWDCVGRRFAINRSTVANDSLEIETFLSVN